MPVTYRQGTLQDSYTAMLVFQEALLDLGRRQGTMPITGGDDPETLAKLWEQRRSLYEHLARTAEQFWIAEKEGRAIGYARSVIRDGVRELTEFFVLPGEQSAGVGRELLDRAFPSEGAEQRVIIATTDIRAQARYLKAGVYARFPVVYFSRAPEAVAVASDLEFEPIETSLQNLKILNRIDQEVLGHTRQVDHEWLLQEREHRFIYRRGGQAVGYGYVGTRSGPFALVGENDFPAVLAHAESLAATARREEFGVEVPQINRAAVKHLLARGFKLDPFLAFFMSADAFGKFENYIFTSPPFFM